MQNLTIIPNELLNQIQHTQTQILEMLKNNSTSANNIDELLTVKQAAQLTKLSEQKIRIMLEAGEIKYRKFGKSIRIYKSNFKEVE